jgi:hypothetical protein
MNTYQQHSASDFLVVASGCSYSTVFWHLVDRLEEQGIQDIRVINVGQPGRSNHWIAHSLIHALSHLKDHPRDRLLVVPCWTSIDRADLVIDRESNAFHARVDYYEFCDPKFFTGDNSWRLWQWPQHLYQPYQVHRPTGLLSMTNIPRDPGSDHDHTAIVQLAQTWYKYIYSETGQWSSTLSNILLLQTYCQAHSLHLFNFAWQSIWHDTSSDHPATRFYGQFHYEPGNPTPDLIHQYHSLALRSEQHPELDYLYLQIDWTLWWEWFSHRCHKGGMADWVIDQDIAWFGGTPLDPTHPRGEGYRAFVDHVLLPRILMVKNSALPMN